MIIWLDHKIFGNGHGLKTPYFDDKFYWLKDTNTGRSELYHWIGGLGAQLASFQWRHARVGERRRIRGVEFEAFQSRRNLIRVEVSWRMVDMPDHDLDREHAMIRAFKAHIDGYMMDLATVEVREAA
jgi:hypothetical protein